MTLTFTADVWYWRGPAPFYFVTVPEEESAALHEIVRSVTYGWGMIPVEAQIGETAWTTALWPKDGKYILPLKDRVRKAESIEEGALVTATLDPVGLGPKDL